MGEEHFCEVVWSEDAGRWINDQMLAQFDVIVFLNTTGGILNAEQQAVMEHFIRSGKGFVGIHSASDTEYLWPWHRNIQREKLQHPTTLSTMKNILLLITSCCLSLLAIGQDSYHANLQAVLQNEYGLPAGTWALPSTEQATIAAAWTYGLDASESLVTGLDFSQKITFDIPQAGTNQWNAGFGISTTAQINAGDACLLVIYLRAAGGGGKASIFVEDGNTYQKEAYLTTELPDQWQMYLIPFEAGKNYTAGSLNTGLHLAWQAQTIEAGGLALLNYGQAVSAGELPQKLYNEFYGGWEPDAPWRAEAAARIDSLRKAKLTLKVVDDQGTPVAGAAISLELLQHEFAFGSAVTPRRLAGNSAYDPLYEEKILNLDGQGHGFNMVVFENALKWPAWEQQWAGSPTETAQATQWLVNNGIRVRGHNILWPGWQHLPTDIFINQNNPGYIKNRIFDHIEELTHFPGIEGQIVDWDVLNEITTNRDLEFALAGQPGYPTGREIYAETFQKLAQEDPASGRWINDYITIGQGNSSGELYDRLKQFIQELIDAGAPIDGIGFQGHIGLFPTSIYQVQTILDDFYASFGKKARITEYDTDPAMTDSLEATYLKDFLTMIFSHPAMDGFLMWGFWDGAHWRNNAPLFYQDWSLKPSGQAFFDLVFNEWWTSETGLTNANGEWSTRGFKGTYKLTIDCGNGGLLTDTIQLSADLTLTKQGGTLVKANETIPASGISIFPNPAWSTLTISSPQPVITARIFNMQGQIILEQRNAVLQIASLPSGRYRIEIITANGTTLRDFVKK